MRDDLIVERVIDLDQAAAAITERAVRWRAAGLRVGHVTWRDEAAPWPPQLETDRALVRDPDSIGVLISGPADAELSVVLFRGGWADVEFSTASTTPERCQQLALLRLPPSGASSIWGRRSSSGAISRHLWVTRTTRYTDRKWKRLDSLSNALD